MFHGLPGNGKSSLALSLAQDIKRNVYMLNASKNMTDATLISLFGDLRANSVLLVEDIDTIFGKDRKSRKNFTFSTLLNCLDGVLSQEDIIVIFTTNHPERLDPALIREGRIDFKLEITNPNKGEIEEYLNLFYEDTVAINAFSENKNLPMVVIQNFCIKHKNNVKKTIKLINKKLKDCENMEKVKLGYIIHGEI
jgi:SpoVK/Ycf46/Vps4 family AAA+-type ATPase